MVDKTCPTCGGALQQPDNFCQRCLDNEIAARLSTVGGFAKDVRWYQQCAPFLGVAFIACLVQVGMFEGVTRSAWRQRVARIKSTIKTPQQRKAACIERNKKLAVAMAEAEVLSEGRSADTVLTDKSWRSNAEFQCLDFGSDESSEQKKELLKNLNGVPRTFYIFIGILSTLLLLLALWSRRRPLLPSVMAAAVSFVAILFMAASDVSHAGWRPQYLLLGVTLLTTVFAAVNGILHARD